LSAVNSRVDIAFLIGMRYNILGFWARGMGHRAMGRKLDVPHGYENGYIEPGKPAIDH
jgi:hypothetical protein